MGADVFFIAMDYKSIRNYINYFKDFINKNDTDNISLEYFFSSNHPEKNKIINNNILYHRFKNKNLKQDFNIKIKNVFVNTVFVGANHSFTVKYFEILSELSLKSIKITENYYINYNIIDQDFIRKIYKMMKYVNKKHYKIDDPVKFSNHKFILKFLLKNKNKILLDEIL